MLPPKVITIARNTTHIDKLNPEAISIFSPYGILKTLPSQLPVNMQIISLYDNQLEILPALPKKLNGLYLWNNCLKTIPPLLRRFDSIIVYDNSLTSLPQGMLSEKISVRGNRLSSLPERLNNSYHVKTDKNPFPRWLKYTTLVPF